MFGHSITFIFHFVYFFYFVFISFYKCFKDGEGKLNGHGTFNDLTSCRMRRIEVVYFFK